MRRTKLWRLLVTLGIILPLTACALQPTPAIPTPASTGTPAFTNTPPPTDTPRLSALTESSFIEPVRRHIFRDLAAAQDSGVGYEEACEEIARRWGLTVDAVKAIAVEGIEKGWLTPTPEATPTPGPPTATPAPTLTVEEQLAQSLHEPWAAEGWETVIGLINQILAINPSYDDMTEKLYAAHVNYGQHLVAEGRLEEAKMEFTRALNVKPDRGEAVVELAALAGETPRLLPVVLPGVATPTSPERPVARVVEALDGDTIQVDIAGSTYVVCYAGIDAPDPATPIGGKAVKANRRFVRGQTVYLERDALEVDQSGCLLRHVFQEDGTLVSARLVSFGYAEVRTDSPNTRYRDMLLGMQQEAQRIGWGLWEPTPIPTLEPTATSTSVPVTITLTATPTSILPTLTPTATATSVPLTPTLTATPTSVPLTPTLTATATSVPLTPTLTATPTSVPPTLTPTATTTATLTGLVVDVTAWVENSTPPHTFESDRLWQNHRGRAT